MPLQATSGAASYDAFGGGKAAVPNYIEDVFSTYLYTGTGALQTINNGIDLSTKGGMVWSKSRSAVGDNHVYDTARGIPKVLFTNGTNPSTTYTSGYDLTSFNTNGFSLGPDDYGANSSGVTYSSWTFRKQPKFFDVVTYTGNGATGRSISHSLGSEPGCIIFKRTDSASDWAVYHRGLNGGSGPEDFRIFLNTTAAQTSGPSYTVSVVSSTTFTLGSDGSGGGSTLTNVNGATYVAYLFAHNAGGFGLTGTDNVISCGSFTTGSGGAASVTLGYEPQWVLTKNTTAPSNWLMHDTMRGLPVGRAGNTLYANASNAENDFQQGLTVNATGFSTIVDTGYAASQTYIYIAIRRGPMKVPTDGTKVFALGANGLGAAGGNLGNLSASDLAVNTQRAISGSTASSPNFVFMDRLRGVGQANTGNTTQALYSSSTAAETSVPSTASSGTAAGTNGAYLFSESGFNSAIRNVCQGDGGNVGYAFRRAPGFFDEVCWTGDSTNPRSINHNLTVAPTLIITKKRNSTSNWTTGYDFASTTYKYFFLNDPGAANADTYASTPVYGGQPTASVFVVGNQGNMNISGDTYVSYLFASCPGVSKVGTYTGTGTTQTINCGFTAGSRFVMIKRTDSTGDWYVWDSARGIVAGNDPYLLLNSTAAEVTSTDYVDTYSAGFEISSTAPAAINASGGTFIFLAIA